ncbi:hypothetical protein [Brachybacterium alimentarium]|uniref:hypothetical protein n=1 Tax=Brachybacterium alimentarium TaxID=47845 RepID=UPI003FD3CC34
MVSTEVPVDKPDKIILEKRQIRVLQKIPQNPGSQIGTEEDIPTTRKVTLSRKSARFVGAKTPHRKVWEHDKRQVRPYFWVGRLATAILFEPTDEFAADNHIEPTIRVSALAADSIHYI